jgi:cob(I)alamin adenosyltransferase
MKGLVHIYTGDGKGKTTAAVGLGVRACGQGLKVLMVQFLKAMPTGEVNALKALEPGFSIRRGSSLKKFTFEMNAQEKATTATEQLDMLEYAAREAAAGKWDMIILDEINYAVKFELITLEDVLALLAAKPSHLHMVLTGRDARDELIAKADLVTEMQEIKHPYQQGIKAQRGIEF